MREYLKSYECKNMIILIFICLIIAYMLIYLFMLNLSDKINMELIKRGMAVVGAIVGKYPEAEANIVYIFTKDLNIDYVDKGREVTQKYGYDESLLRFNNTFVYLHLNNFSNFFVILLSLFCIIFLMKHLSFFKKIFIFANDAVRYTQSFSKDDVCVKLDTNDVGILSNLAFQMQQMAGRVLTSIEGLNDEKKNLKEYLSDISHQLKTPLSSLRIFLDLLSENCKDMESTNIVLMNRKNIEYISKSNTLLDRMEWLIHSLLSMSRIEYSITEMNMEYLDIVSTVDKVVQELWFNMQFKEIQITVKPESRSIYIIHDSNWMGQAIENIIRNSIEFSPVKGLIDIDIDETDVLVKIKIRDNGPGIPVENLGHIFKRFYRGEMSSGRKGTGIGLAFAKLIVDKHHGVISAENAEEGGAVFTISIPRFE